MNIFQLAMNKHALCHTHLRYFLVWSLLSDKKYLAKDGLISKSAEGILNLPEFVPKTILVLFIAVRSVDKMRKSHLII